jgi:hypothetical protein
MIKWLIFFIIISLSWANISFAQLNESDTLKFQLRASLTGNYQQGNVEILNLRSRLDFVVKVSKDVVFKSQLQT